MKIMIVYPCQEVTSILLDIKEEGLLDECNGHSDPEDDKKLHLWGRWFRPQDFSRMQGPIGQKPYLLIDFEREGVYLLPSIDEKDVRNDIKEDDDEWRINDLDVIIDDRSWNVLPFSHGGSGEDAPCGAHSMSVE